MKLEKYSRNSCYSNGKILQDPLEVEEVVQKGFRVEDVVLQDC
ncbi:hypothetical protein [Candidatus Bathycorpusculum sp.]